MGIERYSHLFLTLNGSPDAPRIKRVPFEDQKDVSAFFGMNKNPFSAEFFPYCLYGNPQHETVYKRLYQGIEDGVSFGMLTASAGMGKDFILQRLKSALPGDGYKILDSRIERRLTEKAFLRNVLHGLDHHWIYREEAPSHILLKLLKHTLFAVYDKTKIRLVLLLAGAQNLTPELWHVVKTISNTERSRKKIVTFVLFGDDTLIDILHREDLSSIRHRTFVRERLKPLIPSEIEPYLRHILFQVQYRDRLFSPETFDPIFQATGGICREINGLAYNALVRAFQCGKKIIDADILESETALFSQ